MNRLPRAAMVLAAMLVAPSPHRAQDLIPPQFKLDPSPEDIESPFSERESSPFEDDLPFELDFSNPFADRNESPPGFDRLSVTRGAKPPLQGFGGLGKMKLESIDAVIAEASSKEEFPIDLRIFKHLRNGKGKYSGSVSGDCECSVGISRSRFVVATFSLKNHPERSFTDVIAMDEVKTSFARVRRYADGTLIRFQGVSFPNPLSRLNPRFVSHTAAWSAEVDDPKSKLHGCRVTMVESGFDTTLRWRMRALKDGIEQHDETFHFHRRVLEPPPAAPPKPKPSGLSAFLSNLFDPDKRKDTAPSVKAPEEPVEYTFEDRNFRFVHPEGRYAKLDAKTLNPDATLALVQPAPQCYLIVIAEDTGIDAAMTPEELVQLSQTILRTTAPDAKFGETEERKINGVSFRRFGTNARIGTISVKYRHHVASRNGYLYQLISWTRGHMSDAFLDKETDKLMAGFHLIDPDRVSRHVTDPAPVYKLPSAGITADFSEMGGQVYDTLAEDFPHADHGAYFPGLGGSLVIVPVDIAGLDISDEVLARGIFDTVGFSYPNEVSRTRALTRGTAEGAEFEATLTDQGLHYHYLIRLMRNGGVACLCAGWATAARDKASAHAKVAEMLDALRFEAPDPRTPGGLSKKAKARRGHVLNECGLVFLERGEFDAARQLLETAANDVPDNAIVAGNGATAYERQGRFDDALAFLRARKDLLAANPSLQAKEAGLLASAGRGSEAIARFEALFENGHRGENALLSYLTTLVNLSRADDAGKAIDDYMSNGTPSLRVQRWNAQVRTEMGETAKALAIYRDLHQKNPGNTELLDDLADALLTEDQTDEALGLVAKLEASGASGPARIAYLRGRAEFQKENYRRAKEHFEEAAKHAPGDELVAESLRLASAALGQGDNSLIKDPIEPVPVPGPLADALDGIKMADEGAAGYNAVLLRSVTGFHFEKGKARKRTERRRIRIVNQAGVRDNSTLEFTFDPVYENIHVNRIEVFDRDGKKVASGKTSDYYVSAANAGTLATQERTLYAPVPGLKAGHVIDYMVTREDKSPGESFSFERIVYVSGSPSPFRAVFVSGQPGAVTAVQRNAKFREIREDTFAAWILEQPPIFQWEALMPRFDRFLPVLALGDATADWTRIGTDYLGDIEDRLAPSPETAKLAAEITAGKPGTEAKAQAILQWVQKELAYLGIEFGSRALIPNKSPAILANRYGDCKDHSLLAREMFEAVGIPCHLALVGSGAQLQDSLPALDQFDHMILYSPAIGDGRFFDCTAKGHGFHTTAPLSLGGQTALVLDPKKPRLVTIPRVSEDENVLRSERTLLLDDASSGDLVIRESFVATGSHAGWLREYFRNANAADHHRNIQQILGSLGKFHLESAEIENLDAVNAPFVISMKYRIRKALRPGMAGRASIEVPTIWEDYYFKPHYAQQRKNPFYLEIPMRFESTIRFDPHSAWRPAAASAAAGDGKHPWLTWNVQQPKGDAWTRKSTFALHTGMFEREQYKDYQRALEAALDALKGKLELERK